MTQKINMGEGVFALPPMLMPPFLEAPQAVLDHFCGPNSE